jgi:hypothetical protein
VGYVEVGSGPSRNDLNAVWNVIPSCLMWCIRIEMNA